jgi:hypothetical protein
MKLSDETIAILKNFSTINQSLQFKNGNVLKTISPLKTIFAEATVTEQFPSTFALYDLNKLLAKISLYKDADLGFGVDRLTIATSDNKKSDSIKYCSEKLITVPPEKSITLSDPDCEFSLSQEDLEWMRKSAGISGSPNFVFESDGATITFMATDLKDDSADQSKIEIGTSDTKFRVAMKVENFKMMDGSYDVAVSKKGMARFKNKNVDITYYIAIEAANSKFGEE